MKLNIGISEKHLKSSAKALSVLLSNEMVLYVKTRKSHWNVRGASFMELHKLFEEQYLHLEEVIDQIAERIGKLGHKTIGTMQEFLKLASLKETSDENLSSTDILKILLHDHETLICELRETIELLAKENKDIGTIDFLTGLIEQHETTAWIIRRYIH